MRVGVLAFALAGAIVTGAPSADTAVVSSASAGACALGALSSAARVLIAWTFATPGNAGTQRVELYKLGVLVATLAGDATSYTESVTGFVENGPASRFTAHWVYEVRLVNTADSSIADAILSDPWVQVYGACS